MKSEKILLIEGRLTFYFPQFGHIKTKTNFFSFWIAVVNEIVDRKVITLKSPSFIDKGTIQRGYKWLPVKVS